MKSNYVLEGPISFILQGDVMGFIIGKIKWTWKNLGFESKDLNIKCFFFQVKFDC